MMINLISDTKMIRDNYLLWSGGNGLTDVSTRDHNKFNMASVWFQDRNERRHLLHYFFSIGNSQNDNLFMIWDYQIVGKYQSYVTLGLITAWRAKFVTSITISLYKNGY